MNFLNVGIPELFLLLALVLILLGPERMQQNARTLARRIHQLTKSETWRDFISFYREIKNYPARVMKETKMEEIVRDLNEMNTRTENDLDALNRNLKSLNPLSDITQAVTENHDEMRDSQ